MSEPMMIRKEMQETRENKISKIIDEINRDIQYAVKDGHTSTHFGCYKNNPYYSEVRASFERAGYGIKPTGYIGGVWQLTETIYWYSEGRQYERIKSNCRQDATHKPKGSHNLGASVLLIRGRQSI